MRIAVISDIHSNKYALEEVLRDIKNRQIDTIICTGDLVGYLPFPNEVIDIIRENRILTIKGNHDANVSNTKKLSKVEFENLEIEEVVKKASALYSSFELTESNHRYLKGLPDNLLLSYEGLQLLFVHGSPRSISEYMYDDTDLLQEIAKETSADVIISGHTHLPYHTRACKKDIINAGSVGKPKHGNSNSTYVILDILDGKLSTEIVEVSYDVDRMIQAINKNPFISNDLIGQLKPDK